MILGLDASTSIVGWAFVTGSLVTDAGFLNISKLENNKDKAHSVVGFILGHENWHQIHHINLEAALSGFGGGFTSQQTLITLSRWNAVLEYVLDDELKVPVNLCNVNTMRKKVFGKARIQGIKPKEYVKSQIPLVAPNVGMFEKLNRKNEWDAHNSDMYDAIVCALFG